MTPWIHKELTIPVQWGSWHKEHSPLFHHWDYTVQCFLTEDMVWVHILSETAAIVTKVVLSKGKKEENYESILSVILKNNNYKNFDAVGHQDEKAISFG